MRVEMITQAQPEVFTLQLTKDTGEMFETTPMCIYDLKYLDYARKELGKGLCKLAEDSGLDVCDVLTALEPCLNELVARVKGLNNKETQ